MLETLHTLPNRTYTGPATLHLIKMNLNLEIENLLTQMGWFINGDKHLSIHCEESVIQSDHKWLYLKSRNKTAQIALEAVRGISEGAKRN